MSKLGSFDVDRSYRMIQVDGKSKFCRAAVCEWQISSYGYQKVNNGSSRCMPGWEPIFSECGHGFSIDQLMSTLELVFLHTSGYHLREV
jgi:hypothetical protein